MAIISHELMQHIISRATESAQADAQKQMLVFPPSLLVQRLTDSGPRVIRNDSMPPLPVVYDNGLNNDSAPTPAPEAVGYDVDMPGMTVDEIIQKWKCKGDNS